MRGRVTLAAVWLLAAVAAAPVHGQAPSAPEPVVKAVFVYKFLNYAEWPPAVFADPATPFVIGVIGSDDVARELSQLVADRAVAGRRVEVRRMRRGEPLTGLHVLFTGSAETKELGTLARQAQAQSILLITEDGRGTRPEGAINLVVDGGKVRFDVALDAAERAGIRLSSRLLAVARSVRSVSEP